VRPLPQGFFKKAARVQPNHPRVHSKLVHLYSNTPGLNLWWTRGVTDMLLRYRMMEYVDPGYYARQERDLARFGQKHFVQPALTPFF